MDTYLVFLRLLHIGSGAFWAGTAIYLAAFVLPAAKALGPDGGKFMQQLSMTNNLPLVIFVNSTINILSGILLIWYMSDGFQNNWMGTHMGITLSIGGTVALIAWIIGVFINRPIIMKMAAIAKESAIKQQPPSADEVQHLNKMRAKLSTATNTIAWLIGITVIAMAIARYI